MRTAKRKRLSLPKFGVLLLLLFGVRLTLQRGTLQTKGLCCLQELSAKVTFALFLPMVLYSRQRERMNPITLLVFKCQAATLLLSTVKPINPVYLKQTVENGQLVSVEDIGLKVQTSPSMAVRLQQTVENMVPVSVEVRSLPAITSPSMAVRLLQTVVAVVPVSVEDIWVSAPTSPSMAVRLRQTVAAVLVSVTAVLLVSVADILATAQTSPSMAVRLRQMVLKVLLVSVAEVMLLAVTSTWQPLSN